MASSRIAFLALLLAGSAAAQTTPPDLCTRAASEFDAGTLEVVADDRRPTAAPIHFELGLGHKASASVERDGSLLVTADGGDDVELVNSDDEPMSSENPGNLMLVRVLGRVYLLAHNERELQWLVQIAPGAKPAVLCEYEWSASTRRNQALDDYQRVLKGAKRRNTAPYMYAIARRDASAVRVLSAHKQDINEMKDGRTPLAFAVFQSKDDNTADLALIDLLLDLGADPDRGETASSALNVALGHGKRAIGERLFSRASSVNSVEVPDILRFAEGDAAGRYLREYTRVAQAIDDEALTYALDHGEEELLRYFAGAGLPVREGYRYWINGRQSGLPSWTLRKVRKLRDEPLRRKLEALPVRLRPHKGESIVRDFVEFQRPNRRLVTQANFTKPSTQDPHVLEFATSVCVHLLGGPCGSADTVERARRWMLSLPSSCPWHLMFKYDTPVCILALEYARGDYMMAMGVGDEPLPSVTAVEEIGVRSLATR